MTDLPRDIDMAFVEIGTREGVEAGDTFKERLAAAAVMTIIMTNPSARIYVTVGGWDDDPRAVWEIPEARDCFKRVAGRMMLEGCPLEKMRQHFHEETIYALISSGAWVPDEPVRLVEISPDTPVGHA